VNVAANKFAGSTIYQAKESNMDLKSSELRFEFTFSGGKEHEELFSVADELQTELLKLEGFEAKYEGEFFKTKCLDMLNLSKAMSVAKERIAYLKEQEASLKLTLNNLTKDMAAAGCKGIKPVLEKAANLQEKVNNLVANSGLDLDEFPILGKIVKGK
jgi:hypothetical protein